MEMKNVARAYSKTFEKKVCQEGVIVWKLVLPIGTKD